MGVMETLSIEVITAHAASMEQLLAAAPGITFTVKPALVRRTFVATGSPEALAALSKQVDRFRFDRDAEDAW